MSKSAAIKQSVRGMYTAHPYPQWTKEQRQKGLSKTEKLVFLYNTWNHWRHDMQMRRINRLAGEDVEDVENRFDVALKLYGSKSFEQMTPEEIAVFYDSTVIHTRVPSA